MKWHAPGKGWPKGWSTRRLGYTALASWVALYAALIVLVSVHETVLERSVPTTAIASGEFSETRGGSAAEVCYEAARRTRRGTVYIDDRSPEDGLRIDARYDPDHPSRVWAVPEDEPPVGAVEFLPVVPFFAAIWFSAAWARARFARRSGPPDGQIDSM